MFNRNRTVFVTTCLFAVLTCAASALGGGGHVLPAWEAPYCYSLEDIAKVTAVYNTGIDNGNPLTPPPPRVPFLILVEDATIKPDTMLYVPVFYDDNTGGAPAGFPAHITDQHADAEFLSNVALSQYGITELIIQVDGHTTLLNDDYIVGTKSAPLLDGTPAGNEYIVSAAFLRPLRKGTHIVGIGGMIGGSPVVFISYNVTVE